MCDHRLSYHSEHAGSMTVYCEKCNAQWRADMFIAPHPDGAEPVFLDQSAAAPAGNRRPDSKEPRS